METAEDKLDERLFTFRGTFQAFGELPTRSGIRLRHLVELIEDQHQGTAPPETLLSEQTQETLLTLPGSVLSLAFEGNGNLTCCALETVPRFTG